MSGFTIGQAVVGMSNWPETKAGTQVEFISLPAAQLASAPTKVPAATAATLPLNALTALQALDILGLAEGDTLAVTGAGGGVGGFAVELARGRGLEAVGLASAQDGEFLTRLGATFVPRSEDPAAALRKVVPGGVDGLLDCAAIGDPVMAAVRDSGASAAVSLSAEHRQGGYVHLTWGIHDRSPSEAWHFEATTMHAAGEEMRNLATEIHAFLTSVAQ
ncbi:hypothetical protein FGW37_00105 [Streptomyces rectiverticillatus]|uniref:DUF6228 family protein n=1 Tax=Streptomyces rectiverticillatus TaxID=173860 RepID=UPI0015C36E08|nr:DUF6228 family protein [Streptomyces rectiverticillatus]QLE70231.1 hypothetical protein FGW37_00105 [Streptomyces rectiverticillatus]